MIAESNQYIAVLDTCVLAPMPLCDTLLRLAEDPPFLHSKVVRRYTARASIHPGADGVHACASGPALRLIVERNSGVTPPGFRKFCRLASYQKRDKPLGIKRLRVAGRLLRY